MTDHDMPAVPASEAGDEEQARAQGQRSDERTLAVDHEHRIPWLDRGTDLTETHDGPRILRVRFVRRSAFTSGMLLACAVVAVARHSRSDEAQARLEGRSTRWIS